MGEGPETAAGGAIVTGGEPVPAGRLDGLRALLATFADVRSVVLTTHVNADGDGAGSEAALAAWLASRGVRVRIVNPTPFPEEFRFLLPSPEILGEPGDSAVQRELRSADLLVVLDTGEPSRVGKLERWLGRLRVAILDHHPPSEDGIAGVGVVDPLAAATGELIYDLLRVDEEGGGRIAAWPLPVLEGLYTAIVTDTGSFRFANTTPRVHRVVADLIQRGVDPEKLYRLIYGNVPLSQVRLLQAALEHLEADPELPLTWVSIPWSIVRELGATSRDFDGLVEQARAIEGTEVAILFREVADGSTKVSLRSTGDTDVNAIARELGGGGHVKAAGAVVGAPLGDTRQRVLAIARGVLRTAGARRSVRLEEPAGGRERDGGAVGGA